MRKVNELTLDFVNSNFYNIDEVIYRKDGENCSNYIDKSGYYLIYFKKKDYKVHRILWVLFNQKPIPEDYFIDHIDLNKSNNSKENLRLATYSENNHNCKIRKDNKTGIKGICIKKNKTWTYYCCQIGKNGKRINKQFPYNYDGLESAKAWLEQQREQLHGEFARSE